ncbi:nitronate monooxygenase family protein [Achromobacter sp. UMC46]|uniref:NAD(P)H-dependent flavin oxidoreductase n=1 Tax=Achromobacter sp. UMC46 TaxID=1862319 RepID=UPI0015FFF09D|nr:nitronate monooxygenase family protein [Achromobacter sp. UMC46]MBB1593199.1 2-nitropropane dioxygenase [Achromobacter sp. UMC46]
MEWMKTLELPVVASPMFIASGPELVIAQCRAGIVGSFPALNARPASLLDEWLVQIDAALSDGGQGQASVRPGPVAVNLILHKSNTRLDEDLAVCVRRRVPIVITSVGDPSDFVKEVHGYGGVVLHDVINVRHAEKAIQAGVDGLILVCAGAGGHAGTSSPFALVGEVRRLFDGLLLVAGAVSRGEDILAVQAMGADLAYMGTRFIATPQANVAEGYRQAIVDSTAAGIVYTDHFSGIRANYLRSSVRDAGYDPDHLPNEGRASADFNAASESGKKVWRDIWSAGQGVGNIHGVAPVQAVVAQLKQEYEAALARLARR